MNKKYKKLTIELSEIFQSEFLKFFVNKIEDNEDTSDLINLLISAHVSSLFSLIDSISSEHPEMNKVVKIFISDLTDAIRKIAPINDIEIMNA